MRGGALGSLFEALPELVHELHPAVRRGVLRRERAVRVHALQEHLGDAADHDRRVRPARRALLALHRRGAALRNAERRRGGRAAAPPGERLGGWRGSTRPESLCAGAEGLLPRRPGTAARGHGGDPAGLRVRRAHAFRRQVARRGGLPHKVRVRSAWELADRSDHQLLRAEAALPDPAVQRARRLQDVGSRGSREPYLLLRVRPRLGRSRVRHPAEVAGGGLHAVGLSWPPRCGPVLPGLVGQRPP
mmetsp:Transcript_8335/g.22286  ORF Transcript_8335/g.22286 Transcript_8335/m.22286 type:complete len:246 (-) Transcript_8335:648-1385(-)